MSLPVSVETTNSEKPASPALFTRWHFVTITLLILGYSGYYFCRSDYSVALPLILAEQVRKGTPLNVAQVRLGSIASLGVLAYAVGKFPSGALADIFGGRRNFLGGMVGAIVFTLLFMMGGGFPTFTLAWIGNRLVQSLGWAGLVKVTSRWFSYSTYGSVMAVLSLSYLFGDAVSRGIMSLLLQHGSGWRGIFAAGAGLLAVLLLCNAILLRESPAQRNLPLPEENPLNLFSRADAATTGPSALAIFGTLLRSTTFWLVCGVSLGTTLLRETFNLWTPTYFTQAVGLTNAQAASCSALFPLFGGLSVLAAGFFSDYLGAEGRSRILFGGLCLCTLALVGLGEAPTHASRLVPIALVSTVAFLLIGPYSYLAGAMSLDFGGKEGSATASGLIDGFGYLAGTLSGGAMAHVTITYGWNGMFFLLAAVAALSSVIAGLVLWQQHQRAVALTQRSSRV
ncbi:MAG TPA: MFS transporter [Acidobacteriaceae bacterium]|jgi:OPA family glycerol-3-phosphate transporter-like MFS transporter